MSKTARVARQRVHAAGAAMRRVEQRRHRVMLAWTAVGAVMVVLLAMIVIKVAGGNAPTAQQTGSPVPELLLRAVTGVPASALDQVGQGDVEKAPQPMTGQPALTVDGKPLVVYVGAEYCPFCAAQRWPMVVALSRFGTFNGLSTTYSAADDVFPNTATLSFHDASYTSDYLAFEGVETHSNVRQGDGYARLTL